MSSLIAPRTAALAIVVGTALWLLSIPGTDPTGATGIGFAAAITPLGWCAMAAAAVAIALVVGAVAPGSRWFWPLGLTAVVLLLTTIHGTVAFASDEPRFFTAYQHLGFIEYIGRTGAVDTAEDSRLGWFGAFAAAATISGVEGPSSLLGAVRHAPWLFSVVVLLPVHAVLRSLGLGERARLAALAMFAVANWVGQDYFAPQALGYFLAFTILALVLHLTRIDGPSVRHLRRWWAAPSQRPAAPPALLMVLVLLGAGLIASHQLTPLMLLALLAPMVLTGTVSLRAYPAALALGTLCWLTTAATGFWEGEVGRLFGVTSSDSAGVTSGSVSQNLTERLSTTEGRMLVIGSRVGLSLVVILLAALSLWRYRAVPVVRLTAMLAFAPFPLVAVQSYGGESLLRAFFFSLPFLVALGGRLVADLVVPVKPGEQQPAQPTHRSSTRTMRRLIGDRAGRPARMVPITAVVLLVLAGVSVVARYGNEESERVSSDQLAAVDWIYDSLPERSTIVSFTGTLPLRHRDLDRHRTPRISAFVRLSDGQVDSVYSQLAASEPDVVIYTPQQALFGEQQGGLGNGWAEPILDHLVSLDGAQVAIERPDIVVIVFDRSGLTAAPPAHLTPEADGS
jgi:hypothetical protein